MEKHGGKEAVSPINTGGLQGKANELVLPSSNVKDSKRSGGKSGRGSSRRRNSQQLSGRVFQNTRG